MLAARRLQNSCPQCTAQILKLYVHSIAEISPATARTTRGSISRTRLRPRRNDARFMSTSPRRLRDEQTENTVDETQPGQLPDELVEVPENELPPPDEDPEALVRQAKRMFGDTLPEGYLSEAEFKLYKRLYGAPLRPTRPEDVGFGSFGEADEADVGNALNNVLLRESEEGTLEEVEYTAQSVSTIIGDGEVVSTEEDLLIARPPSDAQLDYIEANASNPREYDALLRLQQDFETARIKSVQAAALAAAEAAEEEALLQEEDEYQEEEEPEEEEEEDPDEEDDKEVDAEFASWYPGHEGPRLHQYTTEGQFRTSPTTLHLPRLDFVQPITELLRRTDTKHIRAAAEKNFGGPGLPHSPATPRSSRNIPQKGLGLEAGHHRMTEIDADAFIATALPGIYSSVMSTLVEVRKRLGPEWLRGLLKRKDADGEGPRVLDHGAGGAGLSAWQSVAQAEWDVLRDKGEVTGDQPAGKRTVVVGSNQLRHRLSDFLENTQFLPRLPNYVHSVDNTEKQLDAPEVPQKRKMYDVIIATHLLMPLDKEWRRREVLDNLWSMLSPDGGVLIVLEKGHPRGFEAVADVRDRLLSQFIIPPTAGPPAETTEQETGRVREPGMIVAPCTNHSKCPMYLAPGLSPGRKDFCHFTQRFIRPPFLQRILEAKHRNHEDINFSYIAVRRGMPGSSPSTSAESSPVTTEDSVDDVLNIKSIRQGREATDQAFAGYEGVDPDSPDRPHPLSLPRNILPPIKRHGHITLDLCTPAGTIERWTVPRSFSKQAYHDARKAQWGDLWALGAKTRVRRSVRLGKGIVEGVPIPQDGGVRATRAAMSGKKGRPKVVEMDYDSKGVLSGRRKGVVGQRPERRTKGGRIPPRERNVFKEVEDDLD
ncbi:37S ribosomal protein S22, mitochondrial [Cytospora mali]|uniref:37S ribosomal protein S22, mitochondrial n=1 Tax=Cytospora mali TaxID=578113 RepID=A0A194WDP0_CYTMA|nr:37S ribosomal protein S22, mitochondrial [Valsa mali]